MASPTKRRYVIHRPDPPSGPGDWLPPGEQEAFRAEVDRLSAEYQPVNDVERRVLDHAAYCRFRRGVWSKGLAAIEASVTRCAEERWEQEQLRQVDQLENLRATEPAASLRGLSGFAAGCRALIKSWRRLEAVRVRDGTWCGADRDEAIRLQGAHPDPHPRRRSEASLLTHLHCTRARPDSDLLDCAHLLMPESLPRHLRAELHAGTVPSPEQSRAWLAELVQWTLARLIEREERLRNEAEAPARAAAVARAMKTDKERAIALRHGRFQDKICASSLETLRMVRSMTLESSPPPS
jgi:hypothetical protein